MPELPDATVYVEALERRITGRALDRIRIAGPWPKTLEELEERRTTRRGPTVISPEP